MSPNSLPARPVRAGFYIITICLSAFTARFRSPRIPAVLRLDRNCRPGAARCSTCHIPPTYTDAQTGAHPPFLHTPAEVGTEPVYASRSATGLYRTTPLRALWQHPPYFHDGSAPNLPSVVDHYNTLFNLGLTTQQKTDLVEFLKTL
jgi:cytochrome c peroxidase